MSAPKLKRGDEVAYYWPAEPQHGVQQIQKVSSVAGGVIFVRSGRGLNVRTDRFDAKTLCGTKGTNPALSIRLATDEDRATVAARQERHELLVRLHALSGSRAESLLIERIRSAVAALESQPPRSITLVAKLSEWRDNDSGDRSGLDWDTPIAHMLAGFVQRTSDGWVWEAYPLPNDPQESKAPLSSMEEAKTAVERVLLAPRTEPWG